MTYNIISSGSQGNAVIINGEILIDVGVSYKMLAPHVKGLKLVLTTHQHSDHLKPSTVRRLHLERPSIRWGCCEWMVGPLLEAGVDKRVIDVCEPHTQYEYATPLVCIEAEPVPHNVPNCGYHILDISTGERLFYVTDVSTLAGVEAKSYDWYLIESNFSRAEVEARIEAKRDAGEYAYELEAMRNHLSREQAEAWLAENAGPNSRYVFLHQHRDKEEKHVKQN